ncbi:hypothetical protein HPB48_004621 [Haemaphysalis longicornis]|uniref:Uncharacterized protein n=1 Tax=Haemaphysalis longicornis TaxID=44386 RepID=A0A9J6H3N1_HAELO|nr:hypothetical protein HPB48_004621 [Haemaphysalis longicornis]
MAALGLDGMVRAVAILDNDTHKALELSAPIKDMYPTMLMDILGKSYKDLMAGIDLEDPFLPNSPEDFAKQFADVSRGDPGGEEGVGGDAGPLAPMTLRGRLMVTYVVPSIILGVPRQKISDCVTQLSDNDALEMVMRTTDAYFLKI